jgi:C-terminal processing protease CtpA/Prc
MKMKFRTLLLTHLAALLMLLCGSVQAQPSPTPAHSAADNARIERLVGLATLWGAVKYFHPYLAYREIDWDRSLIETIPKVNAAKTPEEYKAAVNHMLGALGDKSTYAEIETATKSQEPGKGSVAAKEPVRTENGVLIIEIVEIAKASALNNAAYDEPAGKINKALPTVRAVVIDARSDNPLDEEISYFFSEGLRDLMRRMIDSNVTLGSSRYRMHNGYASQTGTGADFYYSALVNVAPQTIRGLSKTKTPPITFIINQNTPAANELLSGLQFAHRAFIIQDGEVAQETTSGTLTMEMGDGVKVRMRTTEALNPDGSVGFKADAVIPKTSGPDAVMGAAIQAAEQNKGGQSHSANPAGLTTQLSLKDNSYEAMEYPAAEYRLLGLFRFWNVIHYFYPYKELIGSSWASVLQRYIPKFEANQDAVDYQLTVRELVTEMHDSHGGVQNAKASVEKLGAYLPPLLIRWVENQSVITKVLDDELAARAGDVILTVDGEPVAKRREFLARFTAASTPQALMRNVQFNLLRGQKDSVANLSVKGTDGQVREVEVKRTVLGTDRTLFVAGMRATPVVQVLPSGYGYVDLARLQAGEVDKMFETIKTAPAVIFDMRGYPNGTAWPIAPRLSEKQSPVAALFSRPLLEGPTLSDNELSGTVNYSFAQRLPARTGDVYKGKVVMLINEDAISQSEHTCMFFEAATDVTFIGTPTMGADGDVTFMVLPGNLAISFTGHNVRHADGRQLQRLGIQPSITVAPTISGIIAGRDEILDRAIRYLQENLKK